MKLILGTLFALFIMLTFACTNSLLDNSRDDRKISEKFLESMEQTATFNTEDSEFIFVSQQGVTLILNPSCLHFQNTPISGEVEMKFIEIFDKGTMAVSDKHTTGINTKSEFEMLESAGEFYLEFTNNDRILETNCTYELRYENKNDTFIDMDLFLGLILPNGSISWNAYSESDREEVVEENNEYSVFSEFFGWINCDVFRNDSRPKANLKFNIPEKYSDKTRIYLSFDGLEYGLSSTWGQFPIGQPCHYILVADDGDDLEYAIGSLVVIEGLVVEIDKNQIDKISIDELVDEINKLP